MFLEITIILPRKAQDATNKRAFPKNGGRLTFSAETGYTDSEGA